MNCHPSRHRTRALSETDFCRWLGEAFPRDRLEYHVGFLSLDLSPDATLLPDIDRRRLKQVADRAFWAFEAGLVHLVQRRISADRFSYIAVARPRPRVFRSKALPSLAVAGDAQ